MWKIKQFAEQYCEKVNNCSHKEYFSICKQASQMPIYDLLGKFDIWKISPFIYDRKLIGFCVYTRIELDLFVKAMLKRGASPHEVKIKIEQPPSYGFGNGFGNPFQH